MSRLIGGLIIFACLVAVVIGVMSMVNDTANESSQLQEQEKEKIVPEQVAQSEEEYKIEKELSESGLSRKADTELTDQKTITIKETWNENDMRRTELAHSRLVDGIWNDDKYQPMVIAEFENGKLKHIDSCKNLYSYYLLYYGKVYGNQWDYSNNKIITDYLKDRMWDIDCEFKELPEIKEKIDAEKKRVEEATEKVMKELEEVNKEN